jgi:PAS domain S-box-containing protein
VKTPPRTHNESTRLATLRATRLVDSLPEAAFDDLATLAAHICNMPMALVALVDEHREWFKAKVGVEPSDYPRDLGFCAHTILGQELLEVSDAMHDDRFFDNPLVVGAPHIRFYAGAPLVLENGSVLGTLCVLDRKPALLSLAQREALEALARQASAQIELRLHEEEARRNRRLLELAHDSMLSRDFASDSITFWNDGAARLYGYSAEEALGRSSHTLLRTRFPIPLEEIRQQLLAGGRWEGELEHREKSGRVLHVTSRWLLERDETGAPIYILEVNDDVTGRRRAETSARLYSDLVKNTPSAVLVLRCDDELAPALRLVSANPAAADVLPDDAPVGATLGELFPDLAGLLPILHGLARNEARQNLPDVTLTTAAGLRRYAVSAFGLPGLCVGVTLEDVTERERAQSELRAHQLRLQAILDAANEAIFILDAELGIDSASPACQRLFWRPAGTLAGTSLGKLFDEASQARLRRAHDDVRRGAGGGARLEMVALRADGVAFPVEIVFGLLPLPDRLMSTAVMRDLSERKEIERLKSEFVSTVSHELRTPLTSIRGSLGLIEGGVLGQLPDPARELVHIARSNTDRLIRLINDILDLDKIDAGRLELQLRRIDTRELVATTIDGMRGMAAEAQVQLVAQVAAGATFDGDHDRLVQVLTNLVSNAIKYSPAGADVVVRVDRSAEGHLRFSVSDSGPGIAAEQLPKLFGKFQQLDASDRRQRGGTGLGLAISKAIVEHHGGAIGVFSKPGRGSTFWFDVPSLPSTSSLNIIDDATRHTVLLIDGLGDVYSAARGQLAREGFRLLRAASLGEARRLLDRTTPSVVVLDPRLPDGDGFTLLGQLRLPVISTRALLGVQLHRLGMRTTEARDGVDAIRLARAEAPDLIILETELPNGDGFEVVDVLRQERSRATALIVYSGRELSAADRQALMLGPTRHFTKTRSSEEQLFAAVRALMDELTGEEGP